MHQSFESSRRMRYAKKVHFFLLHEVLWLETSWRMKGHSGACPAPKTAASLETDKIWNAPSLERNGVEKSFSFRWLSCVTQGYVEKLE